MMMNALTIDVEDYWSIFFRDFLRKEITPVDVVVRNTQWFLQTLADHETKATFFILGEVAQRFPSLVKAIAQQGHEIGVHGFFHRQIFKLTQEEFRRDISDCKKLLEDIISAPVFGYRAPAFSIMPQTSWALEILAEEGFRYDSSIFPIAGKRYGWPGFSKDICRIKLPSGKTIIGVPLSTVTIGNRVLPAGGGGYIRHLPYALTKWSMNRIQKSRPVIVYMHPYEIETNTPPLQTGHLSHSDKATVLKFHKMQLRNRSTMPRKISTMLSRFCFTTLQQVIENVDLS